ncbi:flotillin family protein [Pseudenhygromyxa sp. WMMC2535]|uniref:flotillin family protein n=1 Tax=Pseudenhygromyxa sp. WMMC2535 TaxID=2712867 RepID=UPI0015525F82|nr:flotillin family protein [Pseudenhygromyxa sp. WMMC2535]NVB43178.1 flotillin family protein [Pseudenhygromyxa sp. WMMC2535]
MSSLFAVIQTEAFGAIAAILVIAFISIVAVIKRVLYVCQPSEVLVFSGRSRVAGGERVAGYRIIRGGRGVRIPLFETVDRMDLTNMIIEVRVQNAYSKGGIPLSVQGVANIKIPGAEPLLNNCLERFLGKSREEIMKIARETLEGNLRGVLAGLTPEQVNKDKEEFASKLAEEAEQDLSKLGLVMDTLKIQNVSDDVGYLDAIGRQISAQIRRSAQIAEAEARAEAAEQKWRNTMAGELAKIDADIEIASKENDRRVADARTRRDAMIAQQLAHVQAAVAQAKAEVDTQDARIQQVRLQLEADVIQPAEAARREAEENAKGDAAQIVEQGRATAKVLTDIADRYNTSGRAGRDILLMQKLVPLLGKMAGSMGELKVDRLTVLGKTDGAASDGGDLAGKLVNYGEQIKAATGVDVPALLRNKLG